jgi:hypothetical protein
MRDGNPRRLLTATLFALIAGLLVAYTNPVQRMKADLRTDAKGLMLSLEYAAGETRITPAKSTLG